MLIARIVCSDPDCWEEREVAVNSLEQLDGYVCECGFGFVLASVSHVREPGGKVIAFKRAGSASSAAGRRRAA